MTFGESISTVFSKYATFKGRASRSEYWWWTLFVFIVSFCVGFVDGLIGMSVLTWIVTIVTFLPSLAVAIRRCHDSNHSGWWVICPVVNIVMMFLPSISGTNLYVKRSY